MKDKIHSRLEKNHLDQCVYFVDCSECENGGNGNATCTTGGKVQAGGHIGCYLGELTKDIKQQLLDEFPNEWEANND